MQYSLYFISALAGLATAIESQSTVAPLFKADSNAIPGRYIVKLKSGNAIQANNDVLLKHMETTEHVYKNVFDGFAGSLSEAEVAFLRLSPSVSAALSLFRKLTGV